MPLRKQKQRRDDGNARPSHAPPSLAVSPPSFNAYSSANRLHQIAARVILELGDVRHDDDYLIAPTNIPDHELKKLVVADTDDDESNCAPADSDDDDDDDDFEFAFVRRDPDTAEIAADELFSDGQIRPTFPVFGRSLPADGAGPSSSSAENNAGSIMLPLRKLSISDTPAASGGGAPPFRVWTPRSPAVPPQPGSCKKSRSTGSSSRRWRLRDLLHRSGSDGKEAFVFLPAGGETLPSEKGKGKNVIPENGPRNKKVLGPVSAHELYMRSRADKEGDKRKSFLPYRPGIMGFFASPP